MQRRRGVVAQAQARDFFDLEGAVCRRFPRVHLEVLAEFAQYGFAPRLGTARARAHANHGPSRGTIVEKSVEAHDAVDFGLGDTQRVADGRQHPGFQAAVLTLGFDQCRQQLRPVAARELPEPRLEGLKVDFR